MIAILLLIIIFILCPPIFFIFLGILGLGVAITAIVYIVLGFLGIIGILLRPIVMIFEWINEYSEKIKEEKVKIEK